MPTDLGKYLCYSRFIYFYFGSVLLPIFYLFDLTRWTKKNRLMIINTMNPNATAPMGRRTKKMKTMVTALG